MDQSKNIETKKHIYDIIAKNPGVHLSKIAELLDMKLVVVKQHLLELEKNNTIRSIDDDGFKKYYLESPRSGIRDKRIAYTKKRIFDLIADNPGLHMSKIAETLGMRLSHVEYHLQQMQKNKIITAAKDIGYYKRYFVVGSFEGTQERKIISLLREEIPLKIVLFLLKHSNVKHKEILNQFDISSSTLSYHLNKLVKCGIINIPLYAEEKGYNIIDRKEIIELLKKYRLIPITKSFIDIWDDLKFK